MKLKKSLIQSYKMLLTNLSVSNEMKWKNQLRCDDKACLGSALIWLTIFLTIAQFFNSIAASNFFIPRPLWRTSKLQEKPSALKREHPALRNMNVLELFSIFASHFCPPGFGSSRPNPLRIHPDPPQHWLRLWEYYEDWLRKHTRIRNINITAS